MQTLLTNWKTTLAGAATILTALGTLATNISNGNISSSTTATAIAAILGGLGLVAAKDGSSTS